MMQVLGLERLLKLREILSNESQALGLLQLVRKLALVVVQRVAAGLHFGADEEPIGPTEADSIEARRCGLGGFFPQPVAAL